ncbi:MAG TPA: PD-(D/E)XK nuclease family protein [Steroidobacteraceae bacterium]|nr:PD-(D/E)XK nuclease family protein [Steroidobacteraceae bacterium]
MPALAAHAALLDAGGEIVTATARQASVLKLRLGLSAARAGHLVWPTPAVYPAGAWLERAARRLEQRPTILGPYAATRLWQLIIEESEAGDGLVSVRAAAADAERAWQLLHDWQLDLAALEASTPEHAAFKGWAREFEARCRARGALDRARLPALLAARSAEAFAPGGPAPHGALGFHGFSGTTPARRTLLGVLAACGRAPVELELAAGPARLARLEAATPDAELEVIGCWLAERLMADPEARLGIIVPDLAERAPAVRRLLEDRLAPALKAPGAPDARPFAFATGRRLADHAVVDAALGLLALGAQSIDVLAFGRLLRSPYIRPWSENMSLGSAAALGAQLDAELRRLGSRLLPIAELLRRIRGSRVGARDVAGRIEAVRGALEGGRRRSAAAWAEVWPRALRAAGWPQGRPLRGSEDQAARRLYELLGTFGELARVLPPLTFAEAERELAALVAATPFEPAIGEPPVVVLDRLENAGLPFEGLWVAGLTADRFPAAAAPNPFLPQSLQRARSMPAATPEATLREAREALAGWQLATPELVLSSARQDGETRLLRSGLVPAAPELSPPAIIPARAAEIRARAELVPWSDGTLPPLAPGLRIEGGVRVLELQSQCPFLAASEARLGAVPLESPGTGLPRRVRGVLMHAALASFWGEVLTHGELTARGPDGRERAAAEAVQSAVEAYRGYLPEGRLLALERRWLERALLTLADVELTRTPFEVIGRESADAVDLGGYALHIRLDRLDRLPDGSTVLIDYKTGKSLPRRWAGARPDALQLPIYAASRAVPPAAVAIARLPIAIDKKFRGLAARDGLLPDVGALERARQPELRGQTWQGLIDEWRAVCVRLALEFGRGIAAVDPADAACERCALAAFCRIEERAVGSGEDEPGADNGAADTGAGGGP